MDRLMKCNCYSLFFVKSIEEHYCRSSRQNIEMYFVEDLNNNARKIIIKQNIIKFIKIFNEKYCIRTEYKSIQFNSKEISNEQKINKHCKEMKNNIYIAIQ